MSRLWKTSVTETSATKSDLVDDTFVTGGERVEPDGSVYVLLYSGESTPDGMVVTVDEDESTATVIHSELCLDGTTKPAIGANNTGATVAVDVYWWAIKRGLGYCVTATNDTKGLPQTPTALGEVTNATTASDYTVGILLETGTDSGQHEILWMIP